MIRHDAIREVKLSVKIDLYKSTYMSLLSLMQLIVTPTPGVLAVVNLVKRVTQHLSNLCACGVQNVQRSFDRVKLGVIIVDVGQ